MITIAVFNQMPGRASLNYMPCRKDVIWRKFHQVGAGVEKALARVKDSQISLGLGTTRRFLSPKHKAFLGAYQGRQSSRYTGP